MTYLIRLAGDDPIDLGAVDDINIIWSQTGIKTIKIDVQLLKTFKEMRGHQILLLSSHNGYKIIKWEVNETNIRLDVSVYEEISSYNLEDYF